MVVATALPYLEWPKSVFSVHGNLTRVYLAISARHSTFILFRWDFWMVHLLNDKRLDGWLSLHIFTSRTISYMSDRCHFKHPYSHNIIKAIALFQPLHCIFILNGFYFGWIVLMPHVTIMSQFVVDIVSRWKMFILCAILLFASRR